MPVFSVQKSIKHVINPNSLEVLQKKYTPQITNHEFQFAVAKV